MVLTLVRDFVVREWRYYGTCAVIFALAWVGPARLASESTRLAISMTAAFCVGPLLVDRFVRREIFLLPVPPRQVWLARWWLATVGATLWVAWPKVLASGISLQFVALSTVCDFFYTGACMGLWPLLEARPRGRRWLRVGAIRAQMILWVALSGGGLVWAFVFRPWLPTEFGDLAGPAGIVMAFAAAATIAGYRHAPGPEAPRSLTRTSGIAAAGRAPAPAPAIPLQPRITGIGYLLWSEAKVSLRYAAAVIVLLGTLSVLLESGGPSAHVQRVVSSIQPTSGEEGRGVGWLVLVIAVAPMGFQWQQAVRQLRTLPLPVFQITALLVAVPVSRWLALLGGAALLAALEPSVRLTVRLDMLVAFVGVASVVQAASLRWSGATPPRLVAGTMVFGFVVVAVGLVMAGIISGAAAGVGLSVPTFVALVTLTLTVLLNHHTLTRRSATFRRPVVSALDR